MFIFSFFERGVSVVIFRECLSFDVEERHRLILKKFLPPVFFLELEFLHKKESGVSVDCPHDRPDEDIARVVHTIMHSGKSHKYDNHNAIFQKSSLEIAHDHHEKCRECHMARRE